MWGLYYNLIGINIVRKNFWKCEAKDTSNGLKIWEVWGGINKRSMLKM